jgi:hypothetical protein
MHPWLGVAAAAAVDSYSRSEVIALFVPILEALPCEFIMRTVKPRELNA